MRRPDESSEGSLETVVIIISLLFIITLIIIAIYCYVKNRKRQLMLRMERERLKEQEKIELASKYPFRGMRERAYQLQGLQQRNG